MRLPKLDDLIGEQLVVYETLPDQSLFVVGPPGSGKTSLAVFRCNYLRERERRGVMVTRNRMLSTLANQLGAPAHTMHSLVSSAYWHRFDRAVPEPFRYQYDWIQIVDDYTEANATSTLDHMVIDEGQNLPSGFFRWVSPFGARYATVFADEDQTTGPQRSTMADICAAGFPNPIRLTVNHRNTVQIAALAEHFHQSAVLAPGTVPAHRVGEKPRLEVMTSWETFADQVALRSVNRGGSIGVIVHAQNEVIHMRELLAARIRPDTRLDAYTSAYPQGAGQIQILQPGITVLTSESVIGLEFDTVYLQDLSRSLPCQALDDYRRMYMLCARARDTLILINGPSALTLGQLAALPGSTILER
ncbi:MAG: hypothetical protein EPN68_01840 [Rhodanobacter sp.]|nr:MAG: hypothetical protein EPN68_01840 [Rhodanobacter sp.]